jgi:tetratricopeptide (TPR) repeat protein
MPYDWPGPERTVGYVPGDPGMAAGERCEAGAALYQQGRNAEAEAAFREALRLDPSLDFAHLGLGNVLLDAGRYAEAEAAFREAVRLDRGNAYAHNGLGWVLQSTGRPRKAQAAFREVSRLRPDLNPWIMVPIHPADYSQQRHVRAARGRWPQNLSMETAAVLKSMAGMPGPSEKGKGGPEAAPTG